MRLSLKGESPYLCGHPTWLTQPKSACAGCEHSTRVCLSSYCVPLSRCRPHVTRCTAQIPPTTYIVLHGSILHDATRSAWKQGSRYHMGNSGRVHEGKSAWSLMGAIADDLMLQEKIARTLIPEATNLGNSDYGRFFVRKLDLWVWSEGLRNGEKRNWVLRRD